MKPSQVKSTLKAILKKKKRPAIFLWGRPGIGKSEVVAQVTKELGIGFIDCRLSQYEPSDLRGVPVPDSAQKRTAWFPPELLPRDGLGILFCDEFNLAAIAIQNAAYQLVLDGKLDQYTVPEGWYVLLAGNDREFASNAVTMPAPLRNRLIHINVETDLHEWLEWAAKNDLDERVIAFIVFRPDLLPTGKEASKAPPKTEKAFPTPRTWYFVSLILELEKELSPELMKELVAGCVGEGAEAAFRTFCKFRAQLPEIQKILDGEDFIHENLGIMASITIALALSAKSEYYSRLFQYAEKCLGKELQVVLVRLMLRRDEKAVNACKEWVPWAKANAESLLPDYNGTGELELMPDPDDKPGTGNEDEGGRSDG